MYTEDSGNATPPVSHCDHNKIKAAAVTKLSIPSEIRYKNQLKIFFQELINLSKMELLIKLN
jgi:hypothetical protein